MLSLKDKIAIGALVTIILAIVIGGVSAAFVIRSRMLADVVVDSDIFNEVPQ
jgi:hypothetical protein